MQYYTNGGPPTQHRPNPLITKDGSKIFTPKDATYKLHGWQPCDAPEPVPEPDPLEGHYADLQAFGALWAETGVEMTDSWPDAMDALEAANIAPLTLIKLLALRLALAPVWDIVLAMMTTQPQHAEEPTE